VADAPVRRSSLAVLTAGTWTLLDATTFSQAFERMYGLFLTVHLANDRVRMRSASGWSHPTLSDYVLSSTPKEFPDSERWSPQPSPHQVRAAPLDLPFGPEVRYLQFLFDYRYTFAPAAIPTITSWMMSSPGRISISGFGHVIKEVREFIKDVKFRNRQEEELGNLEIARKRMELEQSVLSPPALDYMAAQLLTEYKQIEVLEESGKLLSPASFEAFHDSLVRRLTVIADEVPELKPMIRRVKGLGNSRSHSWEKRAKQIETEIREMFHQDKLKEEPYHELTSRLRDLKQVRPAA